MSPDEREARRTLIAEHLDSLAAEVEGLTYEEVVGAAKVLPSEEHAAQERQREEFNDRVAKTGPVAFLDSLPPIGYVPEGAYSAEQRGLISEPGKWAELRRYPYTHGDCTKLANTIKKKWKHPDGTFEVATRTMYTQAPDDRNPNGKSHVSLFVRFMPEDLARQ